MKRLALALLLAAACLLPALSRASAQPLDSHHPASIAKRHRHHRYHRRVRHHYHHAHHRRHH